MGLIPTDLRFLIKLHKEITFEGPVLTLGNQDIWATYDELKSFFRQMDCRFREVEPFKGTSAELVRCLPRAKEFVHAQVFFQMLGIDDYYDVDRFDQDKPKLLHDLNTPIPRDLCDRFSLVLDGGTIEHVFDIRSVMENIVRALRVGGWVIHFSPASHYIDHGFYSFSPCFFYEFYGINGFEDFRCYLLEISTDFPMGYLKPCTYMEYTYGAPITQFLDESKYILILFAARKVNSPDLIRVPDQGTYDPGTKARVQAASSPPVLSNSRSPSLYERRVPKPLQPVLQPLRPYFGKLYSCVFPIRSRPKKRVL